MSISKCSCRNSIQAHVLLHTILFIHYTQVSDQADIGINGSGMRLNRSGMGMDRSDMEMKGSGMGVNELVLLLHIKWREGLS